MNNELVTTSCSEVVWPPTCKQVQAQVCRQVQGQGQVGTGGQEQACSMSWEEDCRLTRQQRQEWQWRGRPEIVLKIDHSEIHKDLLRMLKTGKSFY